MLVDFCFLALPINPNDRKISTASEDELPVGRLNSFKFKTLWDHFGVHEAHESTTCSGTRRFGPDLCRCFGDLVGGGEGHSQEVLKEFERH